MPIHEQITLSDGVEVDVGMANLVSALWKLGLETSYSCQGRTEEPHEKGWSAAAGYILFPEISDALVFFTKTLGPVTSPEHWAHIVVEVRHLSAPGEPFVKRPPAVTLELTKDHYGNEGSLRGCVRFDPDLLPVIETVFAADVA